MRPYFVPHFVIGMSNSTEDAHSKGYYRRHSHRRSRWQKRVRNWLSQNWIDLLVNLLLLVGILLMLDPFRFFVAYDQVETGLVEWFFRKGGAQSLGGAALVTAVLLGAIRLRWRINHRQKWWARGCPECGGNNLSRIHRTWYDRLLGLIGIPLRRYVCRDCHWRGPRIDESHVHS